LRALLRRSVFVLALAAGPLARADDTQPYVSTVHARPRRDDGAAAITLTARELAQRNVQNLAEALDLIPELAVRQGGMGTRLDLRGAKQRSILLLIDGVPIDEPYFGAFDLSAIPITDIVEIRVQLSPASPLEGPGGDGGIVEVFTLRAVGNRRLTARTVFGTTPEAEGALGGRVPLGETWGLRGAAGGRFADPGYPVQPKSTYFDRQLQAYAGARAERETERGRLAVDAWYGHRAFSIPPSDTTGAQIQDVSGEDAARLVVGGEARLGALRIAAGGYGELLARDTDFFTDYTLTTRTSHQSLLTARAGAALTLDRHFSRRALDATLSARLSLDGEGARIDQSGSPRVWGESTYAEAAIGAKLRCRWLRVEGAAGALLPFDHTAATWPEAKLVVGLEPTRWAALTLIGARKGRLPTVRELYDPLQGNRNLAPEQTWHAEAQLAARPHPLVAAHVSAYFRRIDGFIRLNQDPKVAPAARRNVNLDTIDVRGLEAGLDIARERIIGGGVAYLFQDANSPTLGFDPIANLPRHRVDAYLSSTWRRRVGGLLRARYISEREVQNVVLPAYAIVDLTVWARLTDRVRASLRVDDLLDQRYQMLPGVQSLGINGILTVEGTWE
jgi:outer membrane receptor protein involved in Fe transport